MLSRGLNYFSKTAVPKPAPKPAPQPAPQPTKPTEKKISKSKPEEEAPRPTGEKKSKPEKPQEGYDWPAVEEAHHDTDAQPRDEGNSDSERSEMMLEYHESSDSDIDFGGTVQPSRDELVPGTTVEVYSRNIERWVVGSIIKKAKGCVTVRFAIDKAPYRKNMHPDSLNLRIPSAGAGDDSSQAERMAKSSLRSVLVNGSPVAEALLCRWIEPCCFITKNQLTGDCELSYIGAHDEDVVLKVFKASRSREAPTYDYVGFIHAMQPGRRKLLVRGFNVRGPNDSYLLALELRRDLNRPLLCRMHVSRQRSYLRAVCGNLPLACAVNDASQCDFLACFLSQELETNTNLLWRLKQFGVTNGPWGPQKRKVVCCTDASLGLGLHHMNTVELVVGGLTFREPASADNWFKLLGDAASKTKYGVLFLDPSEKYFDRDHSNDLNSWVQLDRQYVYAHDQDKIMLLEEQFRYVLDSAPPLIQAAAKGNIIQVKQLLEDGGLAELTMCDQQQRTALHYAALYGHHDIVEILAAEKADLESWSAGGTTPLHLAALGGHQVAVSELLVAQASLCCCIDMVRIIFKIMIMIMTMRTSEGSRHHHIVVVSPWS